MLLEIDNNVTAVFIFLIILGTFIIFKYYKTKIRIEEIKTNYYISTISENTKIENSQIIYSPKNRQITILLPDWIDIEFNDANQDIIEMDKLE